MSDALILRAPSAMTSPDRDTPVIPDTQSGLRFDFTFDYLRETVADNGRTTSLRDTADAVRLDSRAGELIYPRVVHEAFSGSPRAALSFSGDAAIRTAQDLMIAQSDEPTTIVAAIRNTSAPEVSNSARLVSSTTAVQRSLRLDQTTGRVVSVSAAGSAFTTETVPENAWRMVAAVHGPDGHAAQIIPGQRAANATPASGWEGLTIGSSGGGVGGAFYGRITRIMIFRRALSDADLEALRALWVRDGYLPA